MEVDVRRDGGGAQQAVTLACDTIYALSSGRPPSAIAVLRVSGPQAGPAVEALAGHIPSPRRAALAEIRHPNTHELLDSALLLWMPGPSSVTGEDIAELHLHGGRAVVDAVQDALAGLPGLRPAVPGEFTRRAFDNGRIDLNEAEGLADLLLAETQSQRRQAQSAAAGELSARLATWRQTLLDLSARAEAMIDFSDEGEVSDAGLEGLRRDAAGLADSLDAMLVSAPAERLRDGVRVVIAGPTNSGKSSLFNRLVERDAAIASPIAGTTRDLIEAPVAIGGVPFLFVDTAGLRQSSDPIESEGVERAAAAVEGADIVLWLGEVDGAPQREEVILVHSRSDIRPGQALPRQIAVSAKTGANIAGLIGEITCRALALLPPEGSTVVNRRQRTGIAEMASSLHYLSRSDGLIIVAEHLRVALRVCDALTGRAGVENMLDALFARFCLGK